MRRSGRVVKLLMIMATSGVLPAFIMNCDKAALNFQRGLMQAMGENVGALIVDTVTPMVGG